MEPCSSVSCQKFNLPPWLMAGFWFAMAAVLPVFLALLIAPGRICMAFDFRWPDDQGVFYPMFIAMGLSSAFISGALVGKDILNTSNKGKVIVLGICTVFVAQAIFELGRLCLVLSKTHLNPWTGDLWFMLAYIFLSNLLFGFIFASWMTVPAAIVTASILNKNRRLFN